MGAAVRSGLEKIGTEGLELFGLLNALEARHGFLCKGWGCTPLLAIGFQATSAGWQSSFSAGGQQGRGLAVCC